MASPSTIDNQAYEEAMDDVHTRFILNLPDEELQSAPRIFFQLEQAWWFYDDFICDGAAAAAAQAAAEAEEDEKRAREAAAGWAGIVAGTNNKKKEPSQQPPMEEPLPRFKHVKPFSLAMFRFSPLLRPMLPDFDKMYAEFNKYKRSISTYGTILLNADATKVALCRVYKGKSWTLPGGKVNQNESGKDAAARETYEETGFDPMCERGICGNWMERRERGEIIEELEGEWEQIQRDDEKDDDDEENNSPLLPWSPLQDGDKVIYTENDTKKRRTCYVCRGVPESFPFEPVARKEVSEVKWHSLSDLPKQTYAVLPFVSQLRKWIRKDNKKRGIREKSRARSRGQNQSRARSRGKANNPPSQILKRDEEDEEDDIMLTPFFSDEGNAPWEEEGGEGGGDNSSRILDYEEEEYEGPSSQGGKHSTKKEKQKNKKRQQQRDNSKKKARPSSRSSRASSRGKEVSASDPLVASALASPGDHDRWTEDEMFATNEQILGRKITYDGNPHDFAEKGFDVQGEGRVDPHHFRVVGGAFMNSDGKEPGITGAAPHASMLQPLMNRRVRSDSKHSNVSGLSTSDAEHDGGDDDGLGFTPFFSQDGKAPWEEPTSGDMGLGGMLSDMQISEVGGGGQKEEDTTPPPVRSAGAGALERSNSQGLALLNRLRQGGSAAATNDDNVAEHLAQASIMAAEEGTNTNKKKAKKKKDKKKKNNDGGDAAQSTLTAGEDSNAFNELFMTDREITARSQKEKLSILPPLSSDHQSHQQQASKGKEARHPTPSAPPLSQVVDNQSDEHMIWMRQWVQQQLPRAAPTKVFGDFRLDVNLVLNSMMVPSGPMT